MRYNKKKHKQNLQTHLNCIALKDNNVHLSFEAWERLEVSPCEPRQALWWALVGTQQSINSGLGMMTLATERSLLTTNNSKEEGILFANLIVAHMCAELYVISVCMWNSKYSIFYISAVIDGGAWLQQNSRWRHLWAPVWHAIKSDTVTLWGNKSGLIPHLFMWL